MSIVLTELTKWFANNLVVNKVSLEVADGELFVLLGSSGSGKSTILRLIAGLTEATSGQIELQGRDVTHLPPQARGTGFVFQNYSVFRHMTVADNVSFGLRIRKVSRAERQRHVEELLDLVGLAGLGSRYADQLSGGQQQRVALARAIAYQPAVLLLDEPFGALDVNIRAQLRVSLKDIQHQLHITTILVTHDQEEAFELADRIGVIERGHLIEVGTPEMLYHSPRSEFAAAFVGGGNVLVGREDQGKVRLGSALLPIPLDAPAHEAGSPMRILFRPESVRLQVEPFPDGLGIFTIGQGQIVKRFFSGASLRILLEVENLQGTRPLAPRQIYGQRVTHIEAVQPSVNSALPPEQADVGNRLWIGLERFHILEPTGLKVLICTKSPLGDEAATEFGSRLAHAIGGIVTVVNVAESPSALAKRRDELETLHQRWISDLPHLETHLRQGDSSTEIVHEVQEGYYELVVLGYRKKRKKGSDGLSYIARQVLMLGGAAVLLVQFPRPKIERLLICTATGEPGKNDVLFGARLARRAGAHATVMNVLPSDASLGEKKRVEHHLLQAQSSLDALGVKNQIKIVNGPVAKSILQATEEEDCDVLIIGAPDLNISRPELVTHIVNGTNRPVLIVPIRR